MKQNLIEATENCKNPGAKFEDLKKLESALDEANNLDISSVDTCEGYGVAEDMKNRIEDVSCENDTDRAINGRVDEASAFEAVDLGLIPSRVKPMALKLVVYRLAAQLKGIV